MVGLLSMKSWCSSKPGILFPAGGPFGRKIHLYNSANFLQFESRSEFRANTRVYAHKRRGRKSRRRNPLPNKPSSDGNDKLSDVSSRENGSVQDNIVVPSHDNKFVDSVQDNIVVPSLDNKFVDSVQDNIVVPSHDNTFVDSVQDNIAVPSLDNKFVDSVQDNHVLPSLDNLDSRTLRKVSSRSVVLQACTVSSGLIAGLGVLIRAVSHFASTEGWPVNDCSSEISFSFEMWHLEVITGLVILISSFRFVLLKIWPDFAESSDAANQQVLTNLLPLDYLVVACLPGFSEELLFRGALFPLFGIEWKSALVVSLLFGFLHLGSGRKYSFAIWATFVGLAYTYATVLSSSIIVPMVSHAVNNLVGSAIWRYTSKSTK